MTQFRPCIDLHQGQVKQIVGSTLTDHVDTTSPHQATSSSSTPTTATNLAAAATTTTTTTATATAAAAAAAAAAASSSSSSPSSSSLLTNFSTNIPAYEFAIRYRRDNLKGGHVIMLGPGNEDAARSALAAYPGGMQIGGGITDHNCQEWIQAGASHVIITSYLVPKPHHPDEPCVVRMDRLEQLVALIGKDRLVLDLSCRRKPKTMDMPLMQGEASGNENANATNGNENDLYYVVADRWQRFTDMAVTAENLQLLGQYCDEFLVHGVDVEGKQTGILPDLVEVLGQYSPIPVTYAGGVSSIHDLDLLERLGQGKVHVTVGSALDIFGGTLPYDEVVHWHNARNSTL